MPELTTLDLGRAPYAPTLELQRRLVERVRAAASADACLLLLEHDPPVITLGRRAVQADILVPLDTLAARGTEIHRIRRGGEITWHGPGQFVAYPILHLRRHGLTLRAYVERLQQVIIHTLAHFAVHAETRSGAIGVWADGGKIAAVGVAVDRFVACHGISLNVSNSLEPFRWIVPCGDASAAVTTLEAETGAPVSMPALKGQFAERFAATFGFDRVVESDSR